MTTKGRFRCELCGAEFATEEQRVAHAQEHRGETVTCPDCGAEFQSAEQLRIHRLDPDAAA